MCYMSLFQWAEFIVSTVLSAGITFFVGFIIARFAGKIIKIILHEADVDIFFRKIGYDFSAEEFASKIIEFTVYTGTIAIVLNQFGVLKLIIILLIVLIFLTLLLASIINFKEAIPNFVARLQISNIQIGDKIKINQLKGKVAEIRLFHTKIISENKETFYVPNVVMRKYVKK